MKILKIMFKAIFSLVFIASVLLSLILCFTTTNTLFFKDDVNSRFKLYNNASLEIDNSSSFTIVSETAYNSTSKVTDTISCYKENNEFKCTQISSLFHNSSRIILNKVRVAMIYCFLLD